MRHFAAATALRRAAGFGQIPGLPHPDTGPARVNLLAHNVVNTRVTK
jgi:hypothetical protein